jgi:hypothetical protein
MTQFYQQFGKSRYQQDSERETITIATNFQSSAANEIGRGLHAQPWRHAEIPAYNTLARELRGHRCNLLSPPRFPSRRFHFPHSPDIDIDPHMA